MTAACLIIRGGLVIPCWAERSSSAEHSFFHTIQPVQAPITALIAKCRSTDWEAATRALTDLGLLIERQNTSGYNPENYRLLFSDPQLSPVRPDQTEMEVLKQFVCYYLIAKPQLAVTTAWVLGKFYDPSLSVWIAAGVYRYAVLQPMDAVVSELLLCIPLIVTGDVVPEEIVEAYRLVLRQELPGSVEIVRQQVDFYGIRFDPEQQ